MFRRLAQLCFRRRGRVVLAWVVGIVVLGAVMGAAGTRLSLRLHAARRREQAGHRHPRRRSFGGQGAGQVGNIVFEADAGRRGPRGAPGDRAVPRRGRQDRRGAVARQPVRAGQRGSDLRPWRRRRPDRLRRVRGAVGRVVRGDGARSATRSERRCPTVEGVRIEFGGQAFAEFEVPSSEALGLGFAIIILIIAFGSVLAMGLPIGVALAGIGVRFDHRRAAAQQRRRPCPTSPRRSAVMIGLGVGIDYALFIVTRYRENLHNGPRHRGLDARSRWTPPGGPSSSPASPSSSRCSGMLIMRLSFVSGLAIGAAVVVAHDAGRLAHAAARAARLRRRAHRGDPLARADRRRAGRRRR